MTAISPAPSLVMLAWMAGVEELLSRQALHLAEVEARHDATVQLARAALELAHTSSGPSSARDGSRHHQPAERAAASRLEELARPSASPARGDSSGESTSKEPPQQPTASPPPADAESATHSRIPGDVRDAGESVCDSVLTLTQRLESVERRLAYGQPFAATYADGSMASAESLHAHEGLCVNVCRHSSLNPAAAAQHETPLAGAARPTLEECAALLDALLPPRAAPAASSWSPLKPPGPSPLRTHQQRHVLVLLLCIRDALRGLQASHVAATGVASRPSLDTLLDLPPKTLPFEGRSASEAPWERLLATTSLFTLWTALRDAPVHFSCITPAAAEVLWAAVLWMCLCGTLRGVEASSAQSRPETNPRDAAATATTAGAASGRVPEQRHAPSCHNAATGPRHLETLVRATATRCSAPLQPDCVRTTSTSRSSGPGAHARCVPPASASRRASGAQVRAAVLEHEERWAYRCLPVHAAHTAPTVYDDLFPLSEATSSFTAPGPSCDADPPHKADLDFYTGPARRSRPL